MDAPDLDTVFDDLRSTLDFMSDGGVTDFDCTGESLAAVKRWGTGRRAPETHGSIASRIDSCRRCILRENAVGTITGEGREDADLMFVSAAPGLERENPAEASALFTRMIEAMGISRDDVFVGTIVKCDTGGKEEVLPEHLGGCVFHLKQQIQVIRPRIIVTLGPEAASVLLGPGKPFAALRGRFHSYMGARLLPTFHPAFLQDTPERKREAWQDLQKVIKAMGLSPASS